MLQHFGSAGFEDGGKVRTTAPLPLLVIIIVDRDGGSNFPINAGAAIGEYR